MNTKRNPIPIWLLYAAMLPAVVQAQFTFTTNNGAIIITGYYTGTNVDVSIPSMTNGLPVTGIVSCKFFSGVTNVTVPDSVTNIGFGAFEQFGYPAAGPPNMFLSAITVDTNNSVYSSVDGVLFDKTQGTLIQFPCGKTKSNYSIPDSVINIANNAFFYCTNLASVTIGDNVTNIGDDAFAWCSSLSDVTIGNGVTSIGGQAFFECSTLVRVTIPGSVADIGGGAFQWCYSLTNATIGNGVTSIAPEAFFGCPLRSVTIGNSVTTIGEMAFLHTLLTSVTIPKSVTNIGQGAFFGSPSLLSVYFEGNALTPSNDVSVFGGAKNGTVYYLSGTTGWGATFDGLPTALWLPQAQTGDGGFGVQTNQFGFNINWASGQTVVVEASTDLSNPIWTPVATNTFTGGSSYFSDPKWANYPGRFYRLRGP